MYHRLSGPMSNFAKVHGSYRLISIYGSYRRVNPTLICQSSRMKHTVAVVGAGVAGLASAYHLLDIYHKNNQTIHIDIFDAFGIGSGATGVAAGLLHPFGVSGKLLWQGHIAYAAAEELVQESQRVNPEIFSRTMGLFRPAKNDKQRRQFEKHIGWTPTDELLHAYCVSASSDDAVSGFYIPQGIVLDTKAYLKAIWNLCVIQAQECKSDIHMYTKTITRLKELEEYDTVIVATGAAIHEIEELQGIVELDLCQGYTVEIHHNNNNNNTSEEPHRQERSILGNPYIAFQGSSRAIIGATQKHGISSAEAFHICETSDNNTSEEALQAASTLMDSARAIMPELEDWKVAAVRSGVRGLPTRTPQGSIPYAGNFHEACWIVAGLGARGLVYHAWLGKLTASSIFHGKDMISTEYPELVRWKQGSSIR